MAETDRCNSIQSFTFTEDRQQYKFKRECGSGSFGEVFLFENKDGRQIAVKVEKQKGKQASTTESYYMRRITWKAFSGFRWPAGLPTLEPEFSLESGRCAILDGGLLSTGEGRFDWNQITGSPLPILEVSNEQREAHR
jgi:hypothetical protein